MSHDYYDPENPTYHQSMVDMYQRCGEQYRFRYIEGIKIQPAAALTVGISVDTAVTHNLTQKIETKKDLPLPEVLDAYETDFNRRVDTTDWSGTESGREKDVGAALTKLHHEQAAPKISPKFVQWSFDLETGRGYRVGGTADVIETDNTVEDTKTSKRAYEQTAIDNKFQPAMYTWAYEQVLGQDNAIPRFRYRILIKPTKTMGPRLQVIQGPVTKLSQDWMFHTIDKVHSAIKAGVFIPAQPDSWVCSKQWCGYWNLCRGKK